MTMERWSSEVQSIAPATWRTQSPDPSRSISAPRQQLPTQFSEMYFETVGRAEPLRLIALVESGALDPADTALALEVMARLLPVHFALRPLLEALAHRSAIVREAAVYALGERAGGRPVVREALQPHLDIAIERSAAVREAAANVLAMHE